MREECFYLLGVSEAQETQLGVICDINRMAQKRNCMMVCEVANEICSEWQSSVRLRPGDLSKRRAEKDPVSGATRTISRRSLLALPPPTSNMRYSKTQFYEREERWDITISSRQP